MLEWHTTAGNYEDRRYRMIRFIEEIGGEVSLLPYLDSKGIPTIGGGMNLREGSVLEAVLETFGIDPDASVENRKFRERIERIVSADYPDTKAGEAELQRRLNETLTEYGATQTEFAFQSEQGVRETFDALAFQYEQTIDALLGKLTIPDSNERLALFSLAWNGVLDDSPSLRAAIERGDRAAAWYEIRYNTNPHDVSGIAKRRYHEAALFGLYPPSADGSVSVEAAEAAYRMLGQHRDDILDYEAAHADQVAAANTDYALSGAAEVLSFEECLTPALATLKNEYADVLDAGLTAELGVLDVHVAAKDGGTLTGNSETVDGQTVGRDELLIGSDGHDTINAKGGNDILWGESGSDTLQGGPGDDWLVGGSGKLDTLSGGTGKDTYVFMPGDGHDVITDSDGLGEIRIDGTALTGRTEAAYGKDGATVWKSADGRYVYTLSGGDLINGGRLTITGKALAAGDEILIENFHNGNLGIELNREHRIALLTGVQANPFDGTGYTPESVPVELRERGAQTFTIALNRPARAGERVRLQLGGGAAGAFVVVTGDQTLAFTGGLVELALTGGQDVVTVSIQHQADADAIETLSLSACLVDANGSQVVAERSIELLGEPEAEAPSQFSHTIEGDWRWQDFDASEPGIQVRYDALGNIITDGTPNPGQADDLNDSAGNDEIYAGGGDDTVEALRGGDDLIEGGDGSDYLYGGAGADLVRGGAGRDSAGGGEGNDTVVGGADNDFLSGGSGNDRVFADDEVQVGAVIVAGRSAAGSAGRGDFLDANAGADVVIGSSRSDVLAGGSGNDFLIGGGGNDFIDADESWVVTDRDWRSRHTVEPTPGGDHYTHWIDGAYSRGVDGAGDDVIHADGRIRLARAA